MLLKSYAYGILCNLLKQFSRYMYLYNREQIIVNKTALHMWVTCLQGFSRVQFEAPPLFSELHKLYDQKLTSLRSLFAVDTSFLVF